MEKLLFVSSQGTPEEVFPEIRRRLSEVFLIEAVMGPTLNIPDDAFDIDREQFLTYPILQELSSLTMGRGLKALGIFNSDLFIPQLNFVFGQANKRLGVALISTHRLNEEYYGRQEQSGRFIERIIKEALHETGHLMGLGHCPDKWCVMFYSNTIADTDEKMPRLCTRCRNSLRESGVELEIK